MKRTTTVLILMALGMMVASAQNPNNPCIGASTNTICLTNPSVNLGLITPTNLSACVSNAISASTTPTNSNGSARTVTTFVNCPAENGVPYAVPPIILTNWWAASGPGGFAAAGSGLSATFTPTNPGNGTITFYSQWTSAPPCTASGTATVSTNYCSAKTELAIAPATVTLCETQTMTATISCANVSATDYKFEIRRTNSATWCTLQSGANSVYTSPARIAGRFKVRVTAKINGQDCVSEEVDSEVQFPNYASIVADTNVIAKTDAAWASTKAATTPNSRREEGFWILFNSQTCMYEFTATVLGPAVDTNSTASVNLPPRPADSPATPGPCAAGATYSVCSFHTHTPMTYRSGKRGVGPSAADQNVDSNIDMVPGIVYDYVESPAGSGTIPGGHPIDSAAQRYQSGLNRRPTP